MAESTSTATALTTEQVATILTAPLEATSQFLAAGPTIFDTSEPLRIPATPPSTVPDLTFTGEGEAIPEVDPELDHEVRLMPSTMKSVKTITRYSNELARQSVVALDAVIQNRMVTDVAGKIDAQFFSASGDGVTTPAGMFAWEGVQTLDAVGAITLDAVLEAQALALGANVPLESLRLYLRPDDYMALRGLKDGDQRYMLQPDAQSNSVPTVLGMPVTVSPRIPAGNAALADPTQIAVARDLAPSVTILTERYADTDEQAIRVVTRYDVAPLNPSAVVKLAGITSGGE